MYNATMQHTCSAAEVCYARKPRIPAADNYGAQIAFVREYHKTAHKALKAKGFKRVGQYVAADRDGIVTIYLRINRKVKVKKKKSKK